MVFCINRIKLRLLFIKSKVETGSLCHFFGHFLFSRRVYSCCIKTVLNIINSVGSDLSHLRLFGTIFVKVDSALLIYLHVKYATRPHFASIVHEKYFGAEGPLDRSILVAIITQARP
jgi:hypothetical protein